MSTYMGAWVSQGYIGDSNEQYWYNTDTGEVAQGYNPPAAAPVSTAWAELSAYAPVVSFGSPEDQTAAVSWAASTAVDVPGYGALHFAYADGIHPSGAARINSDDSEDVYYPNADGSISTRHYTAEQVRAASQNTDWTNSYLGPLLAIALPALPSLLAYYGVIGTATAPVVETAATAATVDTSALVAELAAQDAAAAALENTIAETLAQAETLSTAATTAAEASITDPVVQQAAQAAQAASKTLETAATTAATTATPATAASVLANLKTVAAVATTAAATLRAVTNAVNSTVTPYVPGQINPATGLPYLTQSRYGSTNSTMLLLAAGLAAVLLVGGKR